MKTAEKNLLDTMKDFRDSYSALLLAVDHYESNTNRSVNEIPDFIESYPFHKSLDELAIRQWVDNVAESCRSAEFTVLDYTYLNTGGNCMVGIFEVWLPAEKRVVYMLTNEEGCNMAVVDYITNELVIHDYDELIIEAKDWGQMTGHEKYFDLYRYCLNEYTKSDCRHFGYIRGLPYFLLSDELQEQVAADYLAWLESEEIDLIDTDGSKVIVHPDYRSSVAYDDEGLKQLKDFNEWHTEVPADECLRESLYDCDYVVTLRDHSVRIPFNADTWDAVDDLLKRAIADW